MQDGENHNARETLLRTQFERGEELYKSILIMKNGADHSSSAVKCVKMVEYDAWQRVTWFVQICGDLWIVIDSLFKYGKSRYSVDNIAPGWSSHFCKGLFNATKVPKSVWQVQTYYEPLVEHALYEHDDDASKSHLVVKMLDNIEKYSFGVDVGWAPLLLYKSGICIASINLEVALNDVLCQFAANLNKPVT